MGRDGWRGALTRLRTRMIYRADKFLGYPPVLQIVLLVIPTAVVILGWGLLMRWISPHEPAARTATDAAWWSITRFFDGGTMAGDTSRLRLVALGVTASGVVGVSLLTAALASKMAERIQDLRSGRSPVIESDHLLVVGWDPKVVLVAREIARSRQRATLVILANEDKDRIELALRSVHRVRGHRLRLVVRTGEPRSEQALHRAAAERARTIMVVPPFALDDEHSVQWTLSTLLAVRRAVGPNYRGRVVVEARHADTRELLMLAAERDVAGPGALEMQIIGTDEVIAKVLAQSTRQEGIYYALRQLLAFDDCELTLASVPRELVGKRFDESYAAISGAVALGLRTRDGVMHLNPPPGWTHTIDDGDRIVVLGPVGARFTTTGSLPPANESSARESSLAKSPAAERIVLLGFNRSLPNLLRELDRVLSPGSYVRIVSPETVEVRSVVESVAQCTKYVTMEYVAQDPVPLARAGDESLFDANAVVILGALDEGDENGDAAALSTLLWLRHSMRSTGRHVGRLVTELRDPRSAAHIAELEHDFLVTSEVVAMIFAQEALEPDLAPVLREIMSPEGADIVLRRRSHYVGAGHATFADVAAAAREQSEIALGIYPRPGHSARRETSADGSRDSFVAHDHHDAVWLNPPRDVAVPEGESSWVVSLSQHRPGFNCDA